MDDMKVDVSKDMEQLIKGLDNVQKSTISIARMALYDGAGILADEIRKGLNGLPIYQRKDGRPVWGTEEKPIRGVTERQKADILGGFGVSRHYYDSGGVMVSIGISNNNGYTDGWWPYGPAFLLPTVVLLRTLESGNSFVKKIPVIRPAVNRVRKKAILSMQNKFTKVVKDTLKGA